MTDDTPVWLITGCSTGLGRALAETCAAEGFRVVATARDATEVADLAEGRQAQVLATAIDVTSPDQIALAVEQAKARFGRVDVLVNNAGYGYQATIEEGTDAEIRAQFEANVFGLFALTRAVLPVMRAQRSGYIINITSVAGLIGYPGSGYYAASKHAVEGFTDSLGHEVAPLGIKVTCVEPGPFRTDWAGRSLHQTPTRIADYAETAGKRLENTKRISGTQEGDPVRAAEAMIAITKMPDPPRHLPLGKWGYDTILADRRQRVEMIEAVERLAYSADFPAGK